MNPHRLQPMWKFMEILEPLTRRWRNLRIMPTDSTLLWRQMTLPMIRKTKLLLASIGSSSYKLLKNLTSPAAPNSKTYSELILLLKSHFDPQPIVIAERHKFLTAMQEEDESMADFVVHLKKLSLTCCFWKRL